MAKRKRVVKRRRSFFAPKSRRRSTSSSFKVLNVVLPSMAYGAGRQYLTQLAAPLTNKIPLGNYADEAVFGALGYYLAKKQKGMLKQVGISILTVEAASVGNQLLAGMNNGGTPAQSNGFVYG